MDMPLTPFLHAKATGELPRLPVDDVFDMMSSATEDMSALAMSVGLPPEAGAVDPGLVVRPLVESYLDSLARDDGGAMDVAADGAAREYKRHRYSVARALGCPETDVDEAYAALDSGAPEAFDRLFSRYYGA